MQISHLPRQACISVGSRCYVAGEPSYPINIAPLNQALTDQSRNDVQEPLALQELSHGLTTVLNLDSFPPSPGWPQALISNWLKHDDVFERSFLKNMVVTYAGFGDVEEATVERVIPKSIFEGLAEAVSSITLLCDCVLPEGPYILDGNQLFPVWRAYPDIQQAFMLATKPHSDSSQKFEVLPLSNGQDIMVAVPSRIPSLQHSSSPLAGLRISIKDNIDLAGVKTSLSSRAWQELYSERQSTAPAILKLLDLGATVVGKTRLSQFAEVEMPTSDWIDFHCPFNPRGDGYLSPEGSTTGGGVSLAAYDWLDVSVGTDTGGSLREPAQKNGVFGIRPTHGSVSMDGVFPLASDLDTMGILTRDAAILDKVVEEWLGNDDVDIERVLLPSGIVTFTDFRPQNAEADKVFQDFVGQLKTYTGLDETTMSLFDRWDDDNASGEGRPMKEYIGKPHVIASLKNYELWRNTEDFRESYPKVFGRAPYVNPKIRLEWENARKATKKDRDYARVRKAVFKQWFESSILGFDDKTTSNSKIVVVPISDDEVEYRDHYQSGPWQGVPGGFSRNFISVLAGTPEVMIPIGQIPYHSKFSQRQEYYPTVAAILPAPGTDVALTRFVLGFLQKQGLPTSVKTGSVCFDTDKTTAHL